jgi:uroporphyrinogen-III synthase
MVNDFNQEQLILLLQQTKIIAIGPFTSDELKKFNIQNIIADVHTVKGSVDAVLDAFSLA